MTVNTLNNFWQHLTYFHKFILPIGPKSWFDFSKSFHLLFPFSPVVCAIVIFSSSLCYVIYQQNLKKNKKKQNQKNPPRLPLCIFSLHEMYNFFFSFKSKIHHTSRIVNFQAMNTCTKHILLPKKYKNPTKNKDKEKNKRKQTRELGTMKIAIFVKCIFMLFFFCVEKPVVLIFS